MVEATQFEQRLAFEPRTAPVEPVVQDGNSVARESTKPDFLNSSDNEPSPAIANPADSVEISVEAQHRAANDPGSAPQTDTHPASQQDQPGQDLNPTVETSANASIGSTVGETTNDGAPTNQVTSFESERTGNDTQNQTEAGRTLGQVIDTFA